MPLRDDTPPDQADDIALMAHARDGNRAAFECLVRRHQRPLLNFFLRLGVYTDAEDMVQETFVRVYKYRDRYTPTAKFTTFLYTVARNVRMDALRKLERTRALKDRLEAEAEEADDGGLPNAGVRMDTAGALRRLPEKLKSVVVLAVFQGLRYAEIAEILGIPVGTVKSRMFLAIAQLRETFDDLKP